MPYETTTGKTRSDGRRRIDPMFNSAFIRIFGEDESRTLTRGLVNAMLGRAGIEPIGEIDSISAEYSPISGSVECKTPRVDVRIVAANRIIDVEAQNAPEDIDSRSAYYAAQLMVDGTRAGTDYPDIPHVVVLTLLNDEPLFPKSSDFVSSCRMRWSSSEGDDLGEGTDKLLFVLVELSKVRERYTEIGPDVLGDEAIAWAYLLTNGFSDEQEVSSIMAQFPTIEEFAQRYGRAVGDPDVKRDYDLAVSAELEYNSRQRYLARKEREAVERGYKTGYDSGYDLGYDSGYDLGYGTGFGKGSEEERRAIASRLRALGVSEDVIGQAISETDAAESSRNK